MGRDVSLFEGASLLLNDTLIAGPHYNESFLFVLNFRLDSGKINVVAI